tara:strand:+ start:253 stop:600 length:348 start_codon:yes stop_codon:yes gene_type:complete
MINELIKLANHLDEIGREKEADYLDGLIKMSDTTTKSQEDLGANLSNSIDGLSEFLNDNTDKKDHVNISDPGRSISRLNSEMQIINNKMAAVSRVINHLVAFTTILDNRTKFLDQ